MKVIKLYLFKQIKIITLIDEALCQHANNDGHRYENPGWSTQIQWRESPVIPVSGNQIALDGLKKAELLLSSALYVCPAPPGQSNGVTYCMAALCNGGRNINGRPLRMGPKWNQIKARWLHRTLRVALSLVGDSIFAGTQERLLTLTLTAPPPVMLLQCLDVCVLHVFVVLTKWCLWWRRTTHLLQWPWVSITLQLQHSQLTSDPPGLFNDHFRFNLSLL